MISSVFGNTIFGIAKFPKPEVFMFHKVEICGINTSKLKLLSEEVVDCDSVSFREFTDFTVFTYEMILT